MDGSLIGLNKVHNIFKFHLNVKMGSEVAQ